MLRTSMRWLEMSHRRYTPQNTFTRLRQEAENYYEALDAAFEDLHIEADDYSEESFA